MEKLPLFNWVEKHFLKFNTTCIDSRKEVPLKDPSQARLCYCFDPKFAIKLLVERDKTSTVQLVKI